LTQSDDIKGYTESSSSVIILNYNKHEYDGIYVLVYPHSLNLKQKMN